jgi:hypothetical protein
MNSCLDICMAMAARLIQLIVADKYFSCIPTVCKAETLHLIHK